jgi:tRNA-2-methylthio-N6-dimethylallyladenosine synthase
VSQVSDVNVKGTPKKVHVETWGCQMNAADSERMLALLAQQNYQLTPIVEEADLVLLNTCHIREKARHKVLSRLGVLRDLKEQRPGMTIAVAGCVAQAEGRRLLKAAPQIDVLLGPGKIEDLPRLLSEHADTGKSALATGFARHHDDHAAEPTDVDAEAVAPPTLSGKHEVSRYVNIQQGCNNYCTFCVVPFTRGREVSRTIAEVVAESKALLATGARELTLLGQNVNSYGSDNGEPPRFAELLRAVAALPELDRLRFTTSNPHDLTREVADLFATEPKLGRYLHLPVQSGSDPILHRMQRKVTVAEYLERVTWLRSAVPDIAISTDLIVGFPGETEEDFAATMALVEKVGFSFTFSFKYSPRNNTPAYSLTHPTRQHYDQAKFS